MGKTQHINSRFLGFSGIYLFLGLMFFFNLVPVPFIDPEKGRQAFLLAGIYFWTLARPSVLPAVLVFTLGFFLDLIFGGLMGMNTLCFMILTYIVRGQRRYLLGQSWHVLWAGYIVAVAVYYGFQTLVYSLYAFELPDFLALGLDVLISALIYPVLLPFMFGLNRLVSER